LRAVDTPHDIIPFEYEGGLKTWECSLDLVQYLDGDQELLGSLMGKSVIEANLYMIPTSYR
jgi:protein-histidine N-methyltransferase